MDKKIRGEELDLRLSVPSIYDYHYYIIYSVPVPVIEVLCVRAHIDLHKL